MNDGQLPWWRRAPWGALFTMGFLATIAGQVLIGWVVEDIGTVTLSFGHQVGLAAGAFITAAGALLTSKAMPERPARQTSWEDFWWGPMMTGFNAAIILLTLLGIWAIPEALRTLSMGAVAAVGIAILATYLAALALVLFARRGALSAPSGTATSGTTDLSGEGGTEAGRARPRWMMVLLFLSLAMFLMRRDKADDASKGASSQTTSSSYRGSSELLAGSGSPSAATARS